MKSLVNNKIFVLGFILVVFFLLGSITNTLVLNNRGIVVGLGVDETEEGDIKLSCQILVAGEVGADTPSNDNYAILTQSGKTFGEAIQKMMTDNAEYMSFAHCNVIIVGRSMIESGKLEDLLQELLRNSKITENTHVVFYDGESKEMLEQKVAINLMASFSIQRMLSTDKDYPNALKCTIHDYLLGVGGKGNLTVMPEVVVQEIIDEPMKGESSQDDKKVVLSVRRGVCVSGEKVLGKLSTQEVGFYNLVEKDFKLGSFGFTADSGEIKSAEFQSKKSRKQLDLDKGEAKIEIEVEIADKDIINSVYGSEDKEGEEKKLSALLKKGVEELFERFKAMGEDIFGLKEEFYKSFGKRGEQRIKSVEDISLEVEVKVKLLT